MAAHEEPASPEDAKNVRPSITACCSSSAWAGSLELLSPWLTGVASWFSLPLIGYRASLFSVGLSGLTSHSPSDAFMIGGPVGSFTHVAVAPTRSVSARLGAK